ncbi:MAG: low specificity L-threonine aldolase [Bacteroidales bacterium]|nr:low specificity L-threonine aldolase [Bacteroidales bacterium]
MKRGFGSDNHSGFSPEVLEALARANDRHALAYGDDEVTARLEVLIKETFGPQASVYLVFNGTGANVLCIDAMCRSHEAVVCAETAHINVDECGAPQRVVGCRLLTVDTPDGKLTPELVKTRLHGFGFEHHSQPKAISISQPTELGTLYTLDEIRALADLAHSHNMYLHVDGARLANAAVALGCSFKEMTTDLGVDCLSFGGTKNGLLMGESCVLLNPELNIDIKYRRKQMTQLASKMRFMAAQMEAYLVCSGAMQDDNRPNTEHLSQNTAPLWRRNAEHSNRMAQLLKAEVEKVEGVKIIYPVQVNSVFAQLPTAVWHRLQERYFFYDWDEAADVVRWMCSFDTTENDIHSFVNALKEELWRK